MICPKRAQKIKKNVKKIKKTIFKSDTARNLPCKEVAFVTPVGCMYYYFKHVPHAYLRSYRLDSGLIFEKDELATRRRCPNADLTICTKSTGY
jgi:hypothetical protein